MFSMTLLPGGAEPRALALSRHLHGRAVQVDSIKTRVESAHGFSA